MNKDSMPAVTFALGFLVGALLLLAIQSRIKEQITKENEAQLEQMHNVAYEQGYVMATWDSYFKEPQYMVLATETGPELWKKQDTDIINSERIKAEQENNE